MFGSFIKNLRIEKELTLRQFCKLLNEDPSNWSKIERGVAKPPQDEKKLKKIAEILEIKKGEENYNSLFDYASVDSGNIPEYVLSDKELLATLPIFFRTIGSEKPSKEEILDLIESLKKEK